MYDHADSDIRWTNKKYSHFAYLLHCWQLFPCPSLQSLKIFVHTLDILDVNIRHFVGFVEVISSDCTILFCHTNLALFINIFGLKVASTVWAVYAIVCYYYVLILKQRYLTYKHDVHRAIVRCTLLYKCQEHKKREWECISISPSFNYFLLHVFVPSNQNILPWRLWRHGCTVSCISSLHSEPKRVTITYWPLFLSGKKQLAAVV